ncbi:hypothetical protein GCM10010909_31060 [Acidocella aquatica]|uniref:Uncharacterized protein n=1 Tax=Acidocella aquatica TaxID=1922313 RepID=A0ABQ6A7J9_9PROT|nr:hypothetical protein GCM10010909_31060 [Acidocella aquatica]
MAATGSRIERRDTGYTKTSPTPHTINRRILQHLGNRVPMNPKPPRSLAVAQTIDHHGSPDSTIKFHSKLHVA